MQWHEKMDTDKFNKIWDYCYEPIDISLEQVAEYKFTLDNEPDITVTNPEKAYELHTELGKKLTGE